MADQFILGLPVLGSDPGEGHVYVGQEDGPSYRLTVREAMDLHADLLFHIVRAVQEGEAA